MVINGSAAAFSAESCGQLPGRSKLTLRLEIGDVKLTLVQVQDGKMAWPSLEGRELTGERLAEQQARTHQLQVQCLLPLYAYLPTVSVTDTHETARRAPAALPL